MFARQWVGMVGIVLLVAALYAITMTPARVDEGYEDLVSLILRALHRAGVPEHFGYRQLEFTANIALFVPLGFCIGLVMVRLRWIGIFIITALSVLIELAQHLFLPERVASYLDVLANSLGGWIGLLLATIVAIGLGDPDEGDENWDRWHNDGDPRFASR